MKNIYFISDAHLAFKETEIEIVKRKKLLAFLDFITKDNNAGALYLVGDLFDFWFEWYHVVPKYWFPILYRLKQLKESGIQVNFITGNHDFYTGKYLEKEIGINCFNEYCEFQAASKRFFVAHGDGYARADRGYRFLKRVIRNPVSVFLYKTFIPADLGMNIARWCSNSSRRLVKIEKHAWAGEYHKFAQEKFAQGYDYVILGHIHFPMRVEQDNKVYINCGDWMVHFTYAKYNGSTLMLENWKETENCS
ncbi:MAG: UDP-2,3-diacylglucosamine diphosphatase [Acidobacteria bacterium]|jgi:UDP-2,3-diacylglucosamine hydrolase|nr:UDP-2,3-diacylglucosamine diphosphatase [Acidobacteriota bacterium]